MPSLMSLGAAQHFGPAHPLGALGAAGVAALWPITVTGELMISVGNWMAPDSWLTALES